MNLCIVCLDALREDHVTPEIMPHLSALLATGRRYRNVHTKNAWTPPSVAAMLLGDDDAFEKGPDGTVGMPSIAGRLHGTHSTAAFLGQATFATAEALWLFRDFDDIWSSVNAGEAWRICDMDEVWQKFFCWHRGFYAPEPGEYYRHGPWFAYVHLFETHSPYLPGVSEDLPDALLGAAHLQQGYFSPIMDLNTGDLPIPEEGKVYLRDRYRRYCRLTDSRLAKIWPRILNSNTILVVTSDHGDSHGEEGVWGHGRPDVYQTEAARKVLLGVIGPGIEPQELKGGRTNASIANMTCGMLVGHTGQDLAVVESKLRDMGYMG
jgi:arylsulfatase A-like enzyme